MIQKSSNDVEARLKDNFGIEVPMIGKQEPPGSEAGTADVATRAGPAARPERPRGAACETAL